MHPDIQLTLFNNFIVIKAYWLFALLAILLALLMMVQLRHLFAYGLHEIILTFIVCAVFFLFGARLLNYALNRENYIREGYHLFTLSFGHFSVYGGMIMAGMSAIVINRLLKKDFWLFADTIVFPFLSAFALMRVGCFLNGCCYGKVCNNFLGIPAPASKVALYTSVNKLIPLLNKTAENVYPTQLMEMAFALLFIPFGIYVYKKHRGKGYVISLLAIYFSAFRLLLLYFRELPYGDLVTKVIYPIIYVSIIMIGLITFIRRWRLYHDTQ